MYCPSCGSEERQHSQYCRACGTDLRVVRMGLERPDSITASAVSAREQISRAMADKIRQMESSRELKQVAEDVLPQLEKFLESYEEKRMRRIRGGVITAAVGLGATVFGLVLVATTAVAGDKDGFMMMCGMGLITFLIGLSIMVNGLLFTRPKKSLADKSGEARAQNLLDQLTEGTPSAVQTLPTSPTLVHSVTEHTTKHLGNKN